MISADVYQAQAQGRLTKEQVEEVEAFSEMLKGAGAPVDAPPRAPLPTSGQNAISAAQMGLAQGVGAAGAGLVGHGLSKGLKAVGERVTRGRDLKKALDVYPHLNEQYSPEDVKVVWNSLRHLNPWLTKDPLTAGTLLGQTLRNRDVQNPSAAPRMDLGIAKELVRTEPGRSDPLSQSMINALQSGVTEGVRSYGQMQSAGGQTAARQQEQAEERQFRQENFDRELGLRDQSARDMEGFKDELAATGLRGQVDHADKLQLEEEKARHKQEQYDYERGAPMSRSDHEQALLSAALRGGGAGGGPLVEPTADLQGNLVGQRRARRRYPVVASPIPRPPAGARMGGGRGTP